jgi:uncharacterized protein
MELVYWLIIVLFFLVSFVGLIYPIIPGVLFLVGGFIVYGLLFSFEPFNWLFWSIQSLFVLLLFGADYLANMFGVKKFGGSKAGIWGSTIGLLIGPFIIPILGIILGPFIGAVIAELLINKRGLRESLRVGVGSVVGFISSVITKGLIQLFMIIYFLLVVL